MGVTQEAFVPGLDRDLLDPGRLRSWMDVRGLGAGPLRDAELLAGGTQNLLVRFRRADREYVLRRPPAHKRANSDETMRREAVLLAGLAGSRVPHPALIAACADVDVIGAAFYLMEPVSGVNPCAAPAPVHGDPAVQHAMGLGLVDALAALGEVDPEAAGIAHLGRAEQWLERQVPRWRRQLDSYADLDGWSPAELPDLGPLESWLQEHRPRGWRPGLIHGDFHFANVMVAPDGHEIVAVVDWELGTVGDPLLDLGHLLATWPDPERGATPSTVLDLPGLPTRGELVDRYAAVASRGVADVEWYRALACYRLGVLLEGTHARALAGLAPRAVGERLHTTAVALFAQGAAIAS